MPAKKLKNIVSLADRIEWKLKQIYSVEVEAGMTNLDFESWIDKKVLERENENNNQNVIPEKIYLQTHLASIRF